MPAAGSSPQLWLHSSARGVAGVERALCGRAVDVEPWPGPSADRAPRAGDLLLATYERLSDQERTLLESLHSRGVRPVLLSGGLGRADLARLFGAGVLTNLLALDEGAVDPLGLGVALDNLLGADIFGVERHLVDATVHQRWLLTRASDRAEVIRRAEQLAGSLECAPRLAAHYRDVVDEMLTNALYNAAVDAAGQARFAHVDRREEVCLEPHEAVEVKLCSGGRRLGVVVADPFGSLWPGRVLSSLARCYGRGDAQIEYKAGGAGLGLYQMLDSLSELVINIKPGVRTELLGFIEISASYRAFAAKFKSFNLFLDLRS